MATEPGFVVGLPEVMFLFNELDVVFESNFGDGDRIGSNEVVGVVEGRVKDILMGDGLRLT
ncbi:hypothetical protein MU439_03765 [Methanonatronarchaeum sp. AMET6-2]|nr:hypothetical protein MU439_03765 [Methanonatronarchaeum sp. AMET6-2]